MTHAILALYMLSLQGFLANATLEKCCKMPKMVAIDTMATKFQRCEALPLQTQSKVCTTAYFWRCHCVYPIATPRMFSQPQKCVATLRISNHRGCCNRNHCNASGIAIAICYHIHKMWQQWQWQRNQVLQQTLLLRVNSIAIYIPSIATLLLWLLQKGPSIATSRILVAIGEPSITTLLLSLLYMSPLLPLKKLGCQRLFLCCNTEQCGCYSVPLYCHASFVAIAYNCNAMLLP